LVDVAKDELAFASGVAGVHDLGEAPIAQQLSHGAQLITRALYGPQLEGAGQHRQRVQPPGFPRRIVGRRLLELDEVADAPGDDPTGPVDRVLARAAHAEDARQIARDGRLLGDDELHEPAPAYRFSEAARAKLSATRGASPAHGRGYG